MGSAQSLTPLLPGKAELSRGADGCAGWGGPRQHQGWLRGFCASWGTQPPTPHAAPHAHSPTALGHASGPANHRHVIFRAAACRLCAAARCPVHAEVSQEQEADGGGQEDKTPPELQPPARRGLAPCPAPRAEPTDSPQPPLPLGRAPHHEPWLPGCRTGNKEAPPPPPGKVPAGFLGLGFMSQCPKGRATGGHRWLRSEHPTRRPGTSPSRTPRRGLGLSRAPLCTGSPSWGATCCTPAQLTPRALLAPLR